MCANLEQTVQRLLKDCSNFPCYDTDIVPYCSQKTGRTWLLTIRYAESSIFMGLKLRLQLLKSQTPTLTPDSNSDSGLQLWLQTPILTPDSNSDSGLVRHRLLNWCDCISVWVNDADRQILEIFLRIIIPYYYELMKLFGINQRPCIHGLVYYALSIISSYSVRLWKQVRPLQNPLFPHFSDFRI